jgi:uncharacterized surface protein with fasciclin (FAS1) repeats
VGIVGCQKEWDEHYNTYEETVNQNVWEVLQSKPEFSDFVAAIKFYHIDTVFNSDIPYTIFAPTNDAIKKFTGKSGFNDVIVSYHLSSTIINTSSVPGQRQVQTLTKKFALFTRNGAQVTIDNVKVAAESPLYVNGRIFTLGDVIAPLPNLYEFYQFTNPILSKYIDSQDTLILDKEKSKPLGFDEDGNTVYDTVAIIANKFEMKYFPVKHEFRNYASTIVFPKEEDYREALNVMADNLGSSYNDYKDIPIEWQEQVLVPHLLSQGVFLNRIEPEEFIWPSPKDTVKMMNVLGDSVVINYKPVDKALCSNGYAYNYESFVIPDSLYNGGSRTEGEDLLKVAGYNKFAWSDSVVYKADIPLTPLQEYVVGASNDSIIRVGFPKGYKGVFSIEFKTKSLFPRRYYMVMSTHMDIGGIYKIYVNGVLAKTFDYYTFVLSKGIINSVIPGVRYLPRGRFNKFDFWVDNIRNYGPAVVKIEYTAPGNVVSNGIVIDYVEFLPDPTKN